MSLFVVATPIGNDRDFSLRALEVLKSADLVIGEELKALRPILKAAGVQAPALEQLNEHSKLEDVQFFVEECRSKNVALVSDCGTPGFCDPGADLVKACRQAGVQVVPVPGASSLMAFLSVAGVRLDSFLFAGFLPAKAEVRAVELKKLSRETRPIILMETPYRLGRLVDDLAEYFPSRRCVLGLNLTSSDEEIIEAFGRELKSRCSKTEGEPIVLIL